MGSDVIVTYKRKRTLLKSTNHSHFPSESSVSRNSNNLNKQEEKEPSIAPHTKIEEEEKRQSVVKSATTVEEVSLKEDHVEETLISVETVKQDEEPSSSSSELSKKRKSGPPLITFCRRLKQNRSVAIENIKSLGEARPAERPAPTCLVELKNETSNEEKKPSEDVDNASSLSAQAAASAEVIQVDNRSVFPSTRATETSSSATASRAVRDFDCNLLPECDSDENPGPGPSDSTDKKENEQSLALQRIENGSEVRPVSDKGKGLLDSGPVLDKGKNLLGFLRPATERSSGNNYLQLFPENRSSETLRLPCESRKMAITDMVAEERRNQLKPSGSVQASRFLGSSSIQPEPMSNNGPTYYAPVYGWPNFHIPVQTGDPFQDLHQFNSNNSDRAPSLSHKTMLDNILNRARGARGGRSADFFPNTWLDEELDSLWIGVRRHGRGNWDTILKDPRLNFLSWKTPMDLAAKWEEEQSRLFHTPREGPSQFTGHAVVDQNPSYDYTIHKRLLGNPMNVQTTRQVQTPGTNFSPYAYWAPFNPPREARPEPPRNAKGNLPHWLKEAVGTPPGPSESQPQTVILHHMASQRNKRSRGLLKKTEVQNGGKAPCTNPPLVVGRGGAENQRKDLIVIPSDGSSEETVSDDRGVWI